MKHFHNYKAKLSIVLWLNIWFIFCIFYVCDALCDHISHSSSHWLGLLFLLMPLHPQPLLVSLGQSQWSTLLCHRHPDPTGPLCPCSHMGPTPRMGKRVPLCKLHLYILWFLWCSDGRTAIYAESSFIQTRLLTFIVSLLIVPRSHWS